MCQGLVPKGDGLNRFRTWGMRWVCHCYHWSHALVFGAGRSGRDSEGKAQAWEFNAATARQYIYIYVCMYVVCKIIYSHSFFIVAWLKVRQVGCKKRCLHGCCWCLQCQLYTQCSTWFNYSGDLGGEQGTPSLPRYQHGRTCALALCQTHVLQTLWYSIPDQ